MTPMARTCRTQRCLLSGLCLLQTGVHIFIKKKLFKLLKNWLFGQFLFPLKIFNHAHRLRATSSKNSMRPRGFWDLESSSLSPCSSWGSRTRSSGSRWWRRGTDTSATASREELRTRPCDSASYIPQHEMDFIFILSKNLSPICI